MEDEGTAGASGAHAFRDGGFRLLSIRGALAQVYTASGFPPRRHADGWKTLPFWSRIHLQCYRKTPHSTYRLFWWCFHDSPGASLSEEALPRPGVCDPRSRHNEIYERDLSWQFCGCTGLSDGPIVRECAAGRGTGVCYPGSSVRSPHLVDCSLFWTRSLQECRVCSRQRDRGV